MKQRIFKAPKGYLQGKVILHDQMEFLKQQADDLKFDAATVVEVTMAITGIDGERSERETELLHYLTHKLLARELTNPVTEAEAS